MFTENTSSAAFYVSGYLENLGRAVILVGVDIAAGRWVSEVYVIFPDAALSDGLKQTSSYDPAAIPPEWIPSVEDELLDRLKFAESLFWTKLRTQDPQLASWLRDSGELFNGPLTEYGLARLHLSGEFGDQITGVLSLTECAAITEVLRTFAELPMYQTEVETIQHAEETAEAIGNDETQMTKDEGSPKSE